MIRTPDRRVRVFVSSTLQELAPERAAARDAVTTLRHIPVMFELGARSHPSRNLYRAYLEQSDVFVGIYWQSYGWTAPSMDVSGLEDELILSVGKPRLIYLKAPSPDRDPKLQQMINRIKSEDTTSYKSFSTPEELQELLENDLALMLTESFASAQSTPTQSSILSSQSSTSNLPSQITPFIGREKEVERVHEMLRSEARLVTLTGPGGTGKTRLSLQVGQESALDFPDGTWFVELALLTDHSLVVSEVAHTFGLSEQGSRPIIETLKDYLSEKRLLLILDNFEQVTDAAPQIARLLQAAPNVKALVTSRTTLKIRGEQEYAVPPLSLPDARHIPPVEKLIQYEAVKLFIERATDVKPDFEVTNENASTVAEICVRLDGLPLAIELAAACIKILPSHSILSRLSQRLKLLTGGPKDLPARQQTLRNTIEWSYDLLSEGEKQFFWRLAPFSGGRTLQALEEVCNNPFVALTAGSELGNDGQLQMDVLEGVQSLLEKSLLQRREGADGEPRFWMLETIQEYAKEKLEDSGEGDVLGRAHARYFMRLVEQAEPHLYSHRQMEWLDRLEEDYDNLRAALTWSREGDREEDQEIGLRIAWALGYFWDVRGHYSEGREQLAAALASLDALDSPTGVGTIRARSKALAWAGRLAYQQGDHESAKANSEEALAWYRQVGDHGDKWGIAFSLNNLGNVANSFGEYQEASSLLEQSLAIRREIGDRWGIAVTLNNLGLVAFNRRELEAARSHYEQSLVIRREIVDKWGIASSLNNLGLVAFNLSEHEAARSLLEQSLAISRETGDDRVIANALNAMGSLSYMQGEYESARSLYEQSLAIRREKGDKRGVAITLNNLGNVAYMQEEYEAAHTFHKQSLAVHQEIGDKEAIALSLGGVGEAAIRLGRVEDAKGEESLAGVKTVKKGARLLGASDALYEALGSVREPDDRIPYEHATEAARTVLGEAEFERLRQEGRTMSIEQAIEHTLEGDKQS